MDRISPADLQNIVQLCGEVGEIQSADGRIEHFLQGTARLTQTDVLGMVALTHRDDYYELGTAYMLGVDDAAAKIMQEWYLEGGAYRVDPFNRALAEEGEHTLRRQDLLNNSDWYSDPHIEGLKSLGLDGVMASISNMNHQQVALVARREWGARAYSERERDTLDLITQCFRWLFHSLESDGLFGAAPSQVPNRLQQVLDGLLGGLTEKEIATEVMLSPRTVHKYVEQIYRHFGVHSRPQLMALWIRYPKRTGLSRVRVHRQH
jgi:DNA-binding NarL/FixJ family response regulator